MIIDFYKSDADHYQRLRADHLPKTSGQRLSPEVLHARDVQQSNRYSSETKNAVPIDAPFVKVVLPLGMSSRAALLPQQRRLAPHL